MCAVLCMRSLSVAAMRLLRGTNDPMHRLITEAGVKISMDGRGRYLDNIFIERLWRSLKQEAVYLHELTDGFVAERVIDEWITFYNTDRPHTALDKRTPDEAYFDSNKMKKAA